MQKGAIFGALAVIAAAFLVPGNIPATSPVIPGDSTATPARVTASGFLSAEAGLSHAYVLGGEGNIVSTRLRLRAPSGACPSSKRLLFERKALRDPRAAEYLAMREGVEGDE